jgi:hypothetical protein
VRVLSLLIFMALAGSATAAVIGSGEEPAAQASAVAAAGSFSFANSRDGMPIFSATGIAPGDSVGGTIEIANEGELPGELVVTQHDVEDTPGPGGGELSGRLTLRIADVTAPANPITVYSGPLAPMPARPAGVLEPGASRTYEFTATLPETGPGGGAQNDVQGASVSVAYSWTAGEVTASPEPGSPAGPTPAVPPSSSPAVPAGTAPAVAPLRLTIARVRHRIRHGSVVVWARCNTACAIAAHGRLRARGPAGQRGAKLRLGPRPRFRVGKQRLTAPIPHKLRRWLQADPKPLQARVHLSLRARNPAGERATARRSARVRLR